MPLSIRFDERKALPMRARRPSKQHRWEAWEPAGAVWVPLGTKAEADIDGLELPIEAAIKHVEGILPLCDSYHVLVVYQKLPSGGLSVGLARSHGEFTVGQRFAPDCFRCST